jgi:hypothetical protein
VGLVDGRSARFGGVILRGGVEITRGRLAKGQASGVVLLLYWVEGTIDLPGGDWGSKVEELAMLISVQQGDEMW